VAATGGGGLHLYCAYPTDRAVACGKTQRHGVDLKADGGYVCAPPSGHPDGGRYDWINFGEPGPLPAWALPPSRRIPLGAIEEPRDPWIADTLAHPELVEPGTQDETMTRLAYYYAGTNIPFDIAKANLVLWAERLPLGRPDEPWTEQHVKAKLESAYRKRVERTGATGTDAEAGAEAGAADEPGLDSDDAVGSDVNNARRFVSEHGTRVRHIETWRAWFVYGNGKWARDETNEVMRLAQATVKRLLLDAENFGGSHKERLQRIKNALKANNDYPIRALLSQARALCPARPDDFDRDPFLVNCQNGVLDLRTGELRPHRPDDMLSKIVAVPYDPTASCPTWLAFLDRIFDRNQRLIDYMQRALGSALFGELHEQVFHVFFGSGANGKSTLVETVRAAFGDYAVHVAPTTLVRRRNPEGARSDIARMRGARLVTASEFERGALLDEAVVKSLSSGETITARRLYCNEEQFVSAAHVFVSTNYRPRIRGNDHAIWRRVRLVPFTVTIPPEEQDVQLGAKLRAELPGIFAWIVEGALAVQKAGCRLEPVPEVDAAVEQYRRDMDDVGEFIAICTIRRPGRTVAAKELYEAYASWATETGRRPMSIKTLKHALEERGYEQKRTGDSMVWLDLALVEAFRISVRCRACSALVELPPGRVSGACSCGERLRVIPVGMISTTSC
jgi:putative DNA primase/helicase